ncbi:hypothetical protein HPB47_020718 [Ixodes persulcatus]|uniref:Uncharacterized protein n=3 Tax=Ixodes persulcatus TaxID=34615 RepID=A0AC60QEX4_IXOPE|nr:hypothetical protein HPB47_021969 [Ixodes persulcatus]KAG0432560.1 hypothetical protein HPB47_020718 [Ixodes persulcatus]
MPPQARRQYSALFKRKVILFAEAENNVAAERHFGVSEKCVRGWRRQRDQIFACAGTRRSFRGPKQGQYPAVEEAVRKWVVDQRSKSLSVSYEDIECKARAVATELNIARSEFKISKKWVTNFMKRNGLSLRRRTTVCQKLPDAYEEKLQEFHRYEDNPKTPTGRVKRASLSTVAQWVNDAWYGLPADMVRAAFSKCGISTPPPPSGPSDPQGSDSSDCVIVTSDDE